MATVNPAVVALDATEQFPTGVRVVVWEGLDANDTATAYEAPQYSGKAVHAVAEATATVTMQGTLVPSGATSAVVSWATLHDAAGADLVLSDGEMRQVLEDCYQVRPLVSTGTDVDVYLMITTNARR